VKAKPLKNMNDVFDLQFIVQFVCDDKKKEKTEIKKKKKLNTPFFIIS
jgi:hypothetical protein